ncbi:hypothetical protein C8A05DRAFT_46004 [Staphylotrichum tortipilum]|uniref:Protein kinase domain-containing protein n=1 Tax=Staphylotrichum tortipilum TaxID=2831512 RepID=A0AAN6RQV3_9PEZI|nr:hypothetical protein C8A05DRAFT_46004 [Staphylotrichum longicolle]
MSPPANRVLLEDLPEDEPWPPVPPDVELSALDCEIPELAVSMNGMLYQLRGCTRPTVFKFRAMFCKYQLQQAAGDCAIPMHGSVLGKPKGDSRLFFYGFTMDLATPIVSAAVPLSQRRGIMHQMIAVVERLHAKGIVHGDVKLENMLLNDEGVVRLCDSGEGRYVEDEHLWEGRTTWYFVSPNRLARGERSRQDPPPPVLEDDLYGLGLSIWQLYTGETPHGEAAGDDIELKEKQRKGETVDAAAVLDQEAREIVTCLLRQGELNDEILRLYAATWV